VNTSGQPDERGPSGPDENKNPETFEEALNELEKTVDALENGDQSLRQTIDLYERGTRLLKQCHRWLTSTEQRIELITRKADGSVETSDWEPGSPVPEIAETQYPADPSESSPTAGPLTGKRDPGLTADSDTAEGELPF
jgi:exodeoxyribonuclease VII small subunit